MARGPYGRGGGPSTYPGLPTPSGTRGVRGQVALLESRINTILRGLGQSYNIEMAIPNTVRDPPRLVGGGYSKAKQPTLSQVIGWQAHGTTRCPARNQLVITPGLKQNMLDEVTTRFYERARTGEIPTLGQLMPALAYAWRAQIIRRFEGGGGDLNLLPLNPWYRLSKLARGYPARIGTLTGQSLQAIRRSQPIIRRVR